MLLWFLTNRIQIGEIENMTELNPDMILPAEIQLPQNIDDAIKMAKSLAIWLEFIKEKEKDPDERCPMDSYGGNIDGHLIYLTYWFKTEAIKAIAKPLYTSNDSKLMEQKK